MAGYLKGWIVALNAIHLPLISPFRDLSKVPLPEDPPVEEVQQEGQAREREDNPSFRELLEEIEAHTTDVDVIIMEIPNPPMIAQSLVALATQTTPKSTPFVAKQGSNLAFLASGQSPNPTSLATEQRPNP